MEKIKLSEYIDRSALGTEKHLVSLNKKSFQNEEKRPLKIFYQPQIFSLVWGNWGRTLQKQKENSLIAENNIRQEALEIIPVKLGASGIQMDLQFNCGQYQMKYANFKFNYPSPNKSYLGTYTTVQRKRFTGITLSLPPIETLKKFSHDNLLKITEIYKILDEVGNILGIFTRHLNITFNSLNKFKNDESDDLQKARQLMGLKMGLKSDSFHIKNEMPAGNMGVRFLLAKNQVTLPSPEMPMIIMDLAYMTSKSLKTDLTGPIVFSEHSRLKNQERQEVFKALEKSVDKNDFLLQDLLLTNFGFEMQVGIEPGNDFSEVRIDGKNLDWHLGDRLNNWNSHREEINLLKLNKKLSGKSFKKSDNKFSRLYDIELTI